MDIENVTELDISIDNNEENINIDVSEAGPQGLSAYEVYVKNGGSLTEEAWLDSLKGQNGITPNITIGTTQTLDAGSNATVAKTGTTLNPVFSFGIPQGIQGETGVTPELQIGTVQTGSSSSATITGTAEEPVLNLTLQKGDKGEKGDTGTSALDFRVVQTLPTTDISETTIYLLRNEETTGSNLYDEYVYTNNNWEIIGDTSIDLSDYYNKTEVDNLIDNINEVNYDINQASNTNPFVFEEKKKGIYYINSMYSISSRFYYKWKNESQTNYVSNAIFYIILDEDFNFDKLEMNDEFAYVFYINNSDGNVYIGKFYLTSSNGIGIKNSKYVYTVLNSAAQTISGIKTFTSIPRQDASFALTVPTRNDEFTNKKYVDDSITTAIGSINTVLATLTTTSNGGGE